MKASARRRRILMLLGNCPFPQDARVSLEAASLVEAGYEVSIVCPGASGQPRRDRWRGVHVYRYRKPFDPQGPLGYAFEYFQATFAALALSVRVALGRGFDVIHAHNPPDTYWLVGALYKPFGKRFVYDHHDLAPEMYSARFPDRKGRMLRSLLGVLERISYRVSDHVLATNESYRQVAIDRGRMPADKVTVVRNGPDLTRIRLVPDDPELRARAGTLLGYVGVMGYQDGIDHLLRAVAHLVHDLGRADTLAVLIGYGDARDAMQRLAVELDIDSHVWFTGELPAEEFLRLLSTVDVCLDPDPSNPYTDRSTMVKMMEYMALGKPIVAFDLSEHRVTAGEAAVYVQSNNDLAFAKAIADLMDDPERRASMGAIGRRRVESGLTWAHSVPHLLAVYASLFGEPVPS